MVGGDDQGGEQKKANRRTDLFGWSDRQKGGRRCRRGEIGSQKHCATGKEKKQIEGQSCRAREHVDKRTELQVRRDRQSFGVGKIGRQKDRTAKEDGQTEGKFCRGEDTSRQKDIAVKEERRGKRNRQSYGQI